MTSKLLVAIDRPKEPKHLDNWMRSDRCRFSDLNDMETTSLSLSRSACDNCRSKIPIDNYCCSEGIAHYDERSSDFARYIGSCLSNLCIPSEFQVTAIVLVLAAARRPLKVALRQSRESIYRNLNPDCGSNLLPGSY